ncbi:UNVERIFIED_CONTAM: hypothetical protein RMT77_014890 [Armadillidium vulgare]
MSMKCEVEIKDELLEFPGDNVLGKTLRQQGEGSQNGTDPIEEIFIQENIKPEKSEDDNESQSQIISKVSDKTSTDQIEAVYLPENIKKEGLEDDDLNQQISNDVTHSELSEDAGSEFIDNSKEWTQAQSLQLIEEYKNHELIWNPNHQYHTDRMIKQHSWEEVAKKLNRPVDECRKKMECLLSGFRREKLKMKKSIGKDVDEIYRSNWFAYNSLSFLLDKDKPEETVTTYVQNANKMPEYEDIVSTPQAHKEMSSESVLSTQNRRKDQLEEAQLDRELQLLTSFTNVVTNDESQHFGDFIASKLRLYDDLTRSAIQSDIMAIFLKANSGFYNQYQLPSSNKTSPYHVNQPVLPLYPQNRNSSPNSPSNSPNTSRSPSFRFYVPSPCNEAALSGNVSSEDINIPDL